MRSAPGGTWNSPISADRVARAQVGLSDPRLVDGTAYWCESRPLDGGRNVIVMRRGKHPVDLLPHPFSARSRVHEYGGYCWRVLDGMLYFVNDADQQIYRLALGKESAPEALTAAAGYRYADLEIDRKRRRLLAVCEIHHDRNEPLNCIVAVPLEGCREPVEIVARDDFYSAPRLAPNGNRLCWISWNHPHLPWEESMLWCADLARDGSVQSARLIAGDSGESVQQPRWTRDGKMMFISDRDGYWNLYRHEAGFDQSQITSFDGDCGLPLWQFGMSTYDFVNESRAICCVCHDGLWQLVSVNGESRQVTPLPLPFDWISSIDCETDQAIFLAAAEDEPTAVVLYHPYRETYEILTERDESLAELNGYLSRPEPTWFETSAGDRAHVFYYPPTNRDYCLPEGEQPPLIVNCHGGPTGAASTAFNLKIQFWTSRGFAFVDLNYRGSTGFGRQYRERLRGQWGIFDVDDAVAAARHFCSTGRGDPDRCIIRGGSAGGYTALCAMTFHDQFRAGASYYGIGDLESLVAETHKFEARYGDFLVGPHPRFRQRYLDRSPVRHADQLRCPVIFLQGTEDRVVPPNQARTMAAALAATGVDHTLVEYPGEGHGFRRAETIVSALENERQFYADVLKLAPVMAEDTATALRES